MPELIVSCNEGTGFTATGSGARASCGERAERDWAQPAAARLRRVTTNTRFMIGLVSILGDGRPRQTRPMALIRPAADGRPGHAFQKIDPRGRGLSNRRKDPGRTMRSDAPERETEPAARIRRARDLTRTRQEGKPEWEAFDTFGSAFLRRIRSPEPLTYKSVKNRPGYQCLRE
jgi:hypothetical protein